MAELMGYKLKVPEIVAIYVLPAIQFFYHPIILWFSSFFYAILPLFSFDSLKIGFIINFIDFFKFIFAEIILLRNVNLVPQKTLNGFKKSQRHSKNLSILFSKQLLHSHRNGFHWKLFNANLKINLSKKLCKLNLTHVIFKWFFFCSLFISN